MLRVALLLLATSLITSYAYLANPYRAATLATGLIETMLPVRVKIEGAQFALDGTIELEGVEMHVEGMPAAGAKVLAAERIILEHDIWSLLKRQFLPSRMVLKKPELYVTDDPANGRVNLQYLFGAESDDELPDHLPAIFVEEGFVQRGELGPGGYRRVVRVESLAGSLLETSARSGTYAFNMRQTLEGGGQGPMLSGQFSLRQFKASARLEDFPFDSPLLELLPRRLRDICRRFDPSGSLPIVTFEYGGEVNAPITATFDLHDSAISLPVTEPPARLTAVTGRIRINSGKVVPDLTCRIQHTSPQLLADCGIKGWMGPVSGGFDAEVPFRIAVQARGKVPAQRPMVATDEVWQTMPTTSRVLHWLHRWFEPAGTFVADIVVEREQRGDIAPKVLGSVQLSGEGRFRLFPYPLHDVSGQLVLTGDGLEVVGLRGRGLGDARLKVSGTVTPLRKFPKVVVAVEGWDIPVDETLFKSIRMKRPDALKGIHMFMDDKAFAALRDRIASRRQPAPEPGEASEPSSASVTSLLEALDQFKPGGTVAHLRAEIRREPGRNGATDLETILKMDGVAITFRHWPYPLRATGGSLLVSEDRIVADGIEARGVDPRSRFTLDGTVRRGDGGWLDADVDLKVTARDVPLDGILLNTIPEVQARLLDSMALTGRGSAEAVISRKGRGATHYVIKARLADGRIRPFGGRFVIRDLGRRGIESTAWDLTITPGQVTFHNLSGRATTGTGEISSPIKLSGSVHWRDSPVTYDLDVIAESLSFGDPILEVLPSASPLVARLKSLFQRYQPEGVFRGQLELTSGDDGNLDYALRVEPQWISLLLGKQRLRIQNMSGSLHAATGRLALEEVRGNFSGDGEFEVRGVFDPHRTGWADLQFRIAADEVEDTLRSLLPSWMLQVLESMQFQGGYRIENASLQCRPQDGRQGEMNHHFEGTVHLKDARAVLGVPMTTVDAVVKIVVDKKGGLSWPVVAMDVTADQVHVTGRRISPLSMRVVTDGVYADRLRIQDVRGLCYAGKIVGEGWIDLSDHGAYNVRMTVSGAQLAAILRPTVVGKAERTDEIRSKGLLDAMLAVEGRLSEPGSRFGRGSLAVRDAQLYELPLAMGLLQVVSLALPLSSTFEDAQVEYGIAGDEIRFDRIRLSAPTVEMEGSGSMSYDTRRLDLKLAVRRPDELWGNPVTELLEMVKDELVTIRVTGTLEHPVPRVESLGGIRRSWNSVFGPR